MNKQQAIEVLKAHNEWRRDKSDTKNLTMHEPKVIGEAIDVAIAALSDKTVRLPDGWVAVPLELADEMHDAFSDTVCYEVDEYGGVYLTNINQCYKAMLQAAPTSEKES
jgi:hypothetical protein